MAEDRFVDTHDGIRIAVRDYGGDGPSLVFMHGAGTHLLSLQWLAAELTDFHVVTMDCRWSGQSGDSDTYVWDDLVRDVDSVTAALDLGNPIVGGHSWGGMIATHYGITHPDAPAVINLDGHGMGNPSLYDGMTEEQVSEALAQMRALSDAQMGQVRSGDAEWLKTIRDPLTMMAKMQGVPEELVEEFVDRGFVDNEDGTWKLRPNPTMMDGLSGDIGMFDLYAKVECPIQIFNCPKEQAGMPAGMSDLMGAYRRGLRRALAQLEADRPNVRITTMDDQDHMSVVLPGAPAVAAEMRAFLTAVGAATAA